MALGQSGDRANVSGAWTPDYEPSKALLFSEAFSIVLAHDRASPTIEVKDILAGMFIASLEFHELHGYWKDWGAFEGFVSREQGGLGTRFEYWLRLFRARDAGSEKSFHTPFGMKKRSSELAKIYSTAREFALSRTTVPPGAAPVLTPEHLLVAMVKMTECDVGAGLLNIGLNLSQVEEAARGL